MTNRFDTVGLPINSALQSNGETFVPEFVYGVVGRDMYDYFWIVVVGSLFAFTMAVGIGANDVANSFATSVGSRTLKMWQALLIAAFCEFFGAFLLGARVTATIKSGVINVNVFQGHDDLLMIGMLCALIATTAWLAFATVHSFPVSTTQSIVGAIIGYGLCSPGGGDAVSWTGVGRIVGGWFLAPLLSGVAAVIVFWTLRRFVLRAGDKAYDRVFMFFPPLVFITFVINVIFILKKGGVASGKGLAQGTKLTEGEMVGIAFGVGAIGGLITLLVFNRMIRKRIDNMSEARLNRRYAEVTGFEVDAKKGQVESNDVEATGEKPAGASAPGADDFALEDKPADEKPVETKPSVNMEGKKPDDDDDDDYKVGPFEARLDKLFKQDKIHEAIQANQKVNAIHSNAELFPVRVEVAFGYLQVFTACFASFAHGANDVANAIGPLAAIIQIYDNGVGGAAKKSAVPEWILVLGGAGLVVGLALFGHTIIAFMGVKLVKITPARGFTIELCMAFVIVLGSFLGLPLSTTQVCTGGIIGVAILESKAKEAVNWWFLGHMFLGWCLTMVVAGTISATIYSFVTFSPSQVYPLSPHNCIHLYAQLKNATAGDPTSYTQVVDAGNTLAGMYGHPVDGTIFQSL